MAEMKEKSERSKKHRMSALIILLLLTIAAVVVIGSGTLSRYVLQSRQNGIAQASGFFFGSDYLVHEGKTYDIYDWKNGFEVTLFNSDSVNVSSVDVAYSVTVTGGSIDAVTGGSAEASSGILTKDSQNTATLKITPTVGVGETVTVSVATSPYNKPLSASFILKDAGTGSIFSYGNLGVYGILTIKTGAAPADTITVNYGGLAPDNTDSLMRTWTNDSSGTLSSLKSNSTYRLVFFGGGSSRGEQTFTDSISIA